MHSYFKRNYVHAPFIFFLAIHYFLPLIFIGQVGVSIHDNLDAGVVYDHIIGKIYNGNLESINYFLSGEIKWYYLEKIFYPMNILHYALDDKFFYFTIDILKKVFSYFSFYLLAKSLNIKKINCAFGAILYSTLVCVSKPVGFGLVFLPYIAYILLNKDRLNTKHYFLLFLIGLNSPLTQDIFAFIFVIPIIFILSDKVKNFKLYFKVFSIIIISSTLTNIHIVIGSIFGPTLHRETFNKSKDFLYTFKEQFGNMFFTLDLKDPLFVFEIFSVFLLSLLVILSIFKNDKKIRLILFFMFSILIVKSVLVSNFFMENVFVGALEIFRGYHFKFGRITPLAYSLLFIFYIQKTKIKALRNFLYIVFFFAIFFIQLKIPAPAIAQYYLNNNMKEIEIQNIKQSAIKKNYREVFNIMLNKKNYVDAKNEIKYATNKTFDNYYKFEDYSFIKDIVKDSRVMSVGLDPMIAVMNDIAVIDGYHNLYPLKYKIKFRTIIANELEKNIILKKYYDNWGNRVYAFYNDKNNLLLNFQHAKKLGADYIISKFSIENNELENICNKCNGSRKIFLYKIL